jgi:hypothetical protein
MTLNTICSIRYQRRLRREYEKNFSYRRSVAFTRLRNLRRRRREPELVLPMTSVGEIIRESGPDSPAQRIAQG